MDAIIVATAWVILLTIIAVVDFKGLTRSVLLSTWIVMGLIAIAQALF